MPKKEEDLSLKISELEKEIASLKNRVSKLESPDKKVEIVSFSTSSQKDPDTKPETPVKTKKPFEWELLLGGNLIGKFGFVAIILAVIWFLKYAFDNQWINESARIFLGIFGGWGIAFTSLYYAKKNYRILPAPMFGTGIAIVFLSIYAAYEFYDLIGITETFAISALLSVLLSLLSAWTGLEMIYVFSILGAFLTPVLLSQGENSYRFLFTYLSIINILYVYCAGKHRWRVAPFIVLLGNAIIFTGWANSNLGRSSFPIPFVYLMILFLSIGFRETVIFPSLSKDFYKSNIVLTALNIIVFALSGYFTVKQFHPSFTAHFGILVSGGVLFLESLNLKAKSENGYRKISTLHLVFIITAIFESLTDFAEGRWLSAAWISLAGTLSILGSLERNKTLLFLSLPVWVVAFFRLIFWEPGLDAPGILILNPRFALYALAAIFLMFTYFPQRKNLEYPWLRAFAFLALFIIILGSLAENRFAVRDRHYRSLGYSFVLSFYCFSTLLVGFFYSYKSLRLSGIVLGVIIIAKFYLYDIWSMGILVRIIAGLSLGVGLVVISIVYQKYRDKILKTTDLFKPLILLAILNVFWPNQNVMADQNFKASTYKYFKQVAPSRINESEEKITYGKLKLDEEVIQYTNRKDIRVVINGKILPYFLQNVITEEGKSGFRRPEIVYDKNTKEGKIYVLKFPEPPAKTEYTELEISGEENYEAQVEVSLGEKGENKDINWVTTQNYSIYNYNDNEIGVVKKLTFSSGKYRYARLTFNTKANFQFLRAKFSSTFENEERKTVIKLEDLRKSNDPDRDATIYYYSNPKNSPFNRLELAFEEERISRTVEIYHKLEKEFVFFANASLIKKEKKEKFQTIELPTGLRGELKIMIFDGEEKPLNLIGINAFTLIQEVVFELPEDYNNDGDLKIYYGNDYARWPDYSINNTYNTNLKYVYFKAKGHTANPEFAYSIVEPPLSVWIIRALYFIGLFTLAYPAYSIFRKYAEGLKEDNKPE